MNILELEVIKRIKHDDLKAFDLLFTSYYSQLCSFAVDFLKNKQAAEELVSDVFIKIWENRKLLEIKTSFKAYIYKMVQNQCLNFLRDNSSKKKIRSDYFDDFENFRENIEIKDETIFDKILNDQITKDLEQILDTLPAQCREIFSLCRYHDLSYPEIAKQLNISLSTVKTQMVRAMDKMSPIIEKYIR